MTTPEQITWTHAIRRYIYGMLALLFVFALIVVGYSGWSQRSSDRLRHYANGYHLLSSSYYLQATQKLLQVQHDLGRESVEKIAAGESPAATTYRSDDQDYPVMFYLILQEIQAGLELEGSFEDSRFNSLRTVLAKQAAKYEVDTRDYFHQGVFPDHLQEGTKTLLITLNQLIRLHSIGRNQRLAELQLLKERHSLILYILLSVLFATGFLLSRRGLVAIERIIAGQQQADEKIKHQAYFDSLTNLPNRQLSLDRLTHQMNKASRDNNRVAVLFLDLDDFKKVNDTLGHDVGDKLLIEAAGRLSSAVRRGDTVGRLGGDEFILILGGITDVADVQYIAEKLIEQVKEVFRIDGREMMLSASIGISVFPEDGDDESTLLRNADSAMYHSKSMGRNTYSYFTDEMNEGVTRRLALEEQMHGALDRSEFTVVYQKKIELEHGTIIGAEALLRWHNPTLGSVSPQEFIPIAEQTGLIVPIGRFVLSEALAMTALWQLEQYPQFRIAVNVSPRQFRDPQLVSHIEETVRESGMSSPYLELEITEGLLMSGHDSIHQALTELSELGVSIAMDDFGTGYSSLSYLRSYPFDVVKIDRSFISDIDADSETRELINASISMAHALHLKVVAEGVETEEQLAYLKKLRCDYAQGHLFAEPLSGDEMTEAMKSQGKQRLAGTGLSA